MSSTTTLTVEAGAATSTMSTASYCPQCGFGLDLPPFQDSEVALLEAQHRIEDLEAQARQLNQKATSAIDRWATYEDELAKLRSALDASKKGEEEQAQTQQQQHPSQTPPAPAADPPSRSSFLPAAAASRLSAFLSPRKSTPNLQASLSSRTPQHQHQRSGTPAGPPSPSPSPSPSPAPAPSPAAAPPSPTPSNSELVEALTREQDLRRAAEGRLSDTSKEIEELSVQLFEQANEMVATERKARAALEERVATLERRDAEKRRRLERLESALGSIDRSKALLSSSSSSVPSPPPSTAATSLVAELGFSRWKS